MPQDLDGLGRAPGLGWKAQVRVVVGSGPTVVLRALSLNRCCLSTVAVSQPLPSLNR